jgi:hypothetical protein
MRGTLLSLATASLLLLPTAVRGEGPKEPGRPDPGMLFERLDQNHDGVLTAQEVADHGPPLLKDLLKASDKQGITKERFLAAIQERREAKHRLGPGPADGPGPVAGHRRGAGPGPEARPAAPGPRGPMADTPAEGRRHGPPMAGGPEAGRRPGPAPAVAPGAHKPFDVKALFAQFDKDKNGQLSLDEFAVGMKHLHEKMLAHFRGSRLVAPPMAGPRGMGERREGFRPEGPGPLAWREWHDGPPPLHYAPDGERRPWMDRGPRGPWHGEQAFRGEFRGELRGEFRGAMERPHMRPPFAGAMPDGPQDGRRGEARAARPGDPLKSIEAKLLELDAKLKAIESRLPK